MTIEALPDDFIDELIGVSSDVDSIPASGVVGDTSMKLDIEASGDTKFIWCEFCKGYYNEYHFGGTDE